MSGELAPTADTAPASLVVPSLPVTTSPAATGSDAFSRAVSALERASTVEEPDPSTVGEGEPATPETVEPVVDAVSKEESTSKRWALIRRAEARSQAKRMDLKRERQAIATERARVAKELAAIEKMKSGRALEGLREAGIDYNELTRQMLMGKAAQPVAEVEQLRAEMQSMKARLQDQENERYIREYKTEVRGMVESGGTRWASVRRLPGFDDHIVKEIQAHHSSVGIAITPEEAADRIERNLRDFFAKQLDENEALQEIARTRLQAKSSIAQTANGAKATKPTNGEVKPKTLTNGDSGTVAARAMSGRTDDECRNRAIAALSAIEPD